ncbi:delta endotoxin C-terminal domain-containing protein [Bacillus thuringiensis]|nr:delta endotoxin C-terminal domain-containing protein [Bacillus thuringiensis]
MNTINFSTNEEEFKIGLSCNNGGPIFIDQIEFIPR